jgi:Protein of unknown function (DUF3237)
MAGPGAKRTSRLRCAMLPVLPVVSVYAFMIATKENGATGWDDQYMRLVMRFDIGAERYRWLNTSLFIAKGRLIRTGSVECEVFRVT